MVISLFLNTIPVAAQEDPFPLPDVDGDSLSNDLEIDGWYNLSGGPYRTDPYDRDSDDDGLTDGEEKLFDTNPLDLHSPGIAVKYEDSFETRQYFNTTDPAYLSIKQGGDQFLLQEALVIRRGTTFTIAGPARGTLTLTGTNMTAITPFRDPANGGWSITIPMNGTVGTYIATVSDGYWTKSMPVYVIFEIPDDLPQDEVDAFLYDGDSENKRDEVVPFFRMDEWPYYNQHNINPGCPYPEDPNQPCSNWQYHLAFGYSQAYWTEQFTKSAFVDHAIKGMHGKTSQADATYSLSRWFDTEFRTQHGRLQNNWSSAMYSWFDGIGYTASGGYCETTATTYAAILRSAGIPASVFQIDYNKTVGHGESGQFGNTYEYDTSTMMWYGGRWYAQRAYSGASDDGTYYPWNLGVTAITTLDTYIDGPGYYYSDRYGDGIFSVNQDWDFQIGSNAGGTVNQVWPIPSAEWASINRDYQWDSKLPLQITQSPDVEVMNYLFFNDDNWQPSEWRRPPVSDPPGRNEYLTYILPDGVIDPENELENWPISPRPIACSPATPADECAAFLASWTPENTINSSLAVSSAVEKGAFTLFLPLINNQNSTVASIELGKIIDDNSIDIDGDGYFDELIVKFEVTSSVESVVRFGGFLDIGENELRGATKSITLKPGTQIVEISFDGFEIADNKVDGPYTVKALWAANPDQTDLVFVDPGKTLDYQDYSYSTNAYQYSQFEILAATIDSDGISHMGIDNDKNGLFESIVINIPLIIDIPGSLSVDGDLYDSRGDFVGNATWTGIDKEAKLKFNVVKTSPPYKLEHLKLTITNGEILDSRFATSYEINDMDGKIEAGNVIIGSGSSGDPSLSQPLGVDPTGVYTIIPVDTNVNGLFDKLRVEVGVTVTESGGDYRIEGLLEDDHGTEIAWVVSDPQPLTIGNRTMTLDFDGKMLYDQLPLTGARAFKLVAVKIFSGNLSTTTLESEAKFATNTPAYTRNQFEPSSTAITLFQDDLENGTSQWALTGTFWNLNSGTWNSWTNAWVASSTVNGSGQLTIDPPLDFSDYAGPVLHFDNAYRLGSSLDKGVVEVSINGGTTWTAIETYNGVDTSPHWMTEDVDLSAFGEMADVQLRFNATRGSTSGILWYLDDIYINAWPAVKTASFTYPIEVIAGEPATFTASYTSIDTTIPVSYKWSFNGEEVITSSPTTNLSIPEIGDVSVTLTVSSPYDSASSTQTITVLSNPDQFILNVDVTPFAGGTVTRNPDQIAFDPGTEVILTAVPNEGYTFNGWSGGGCSGMGTCIVTMNADTTITAEFVPIEYDLTILLDGFGEVSQNPEKETYHYGDEVQLTALPGPTYGFSQWSGDLVSTTESVIITIDGDKLITAEFVPGYSVAVNNIGSGTITKYPDKETYLPGEQVTLTPFPDLNWEFSNWSGGCTGNGACVVTMNSNIDVTATFTKSQFTLKFGIHGNGTILKDPDQVTYSSGQRVILTANPDENWRFSGWGSALTGSVNPSAITITGDTTVFATFVDTFPFPAATISPTNSGTVTKSPSRTTYTYGSAVIVTAVPNPGFLFDHWEGSCTGSTNPCLVTVDGNESVTAYFTAIEYTLLAKTIGLGSVSKDPFKATYHYGDVVSLNAIGNNGWTFDSWSGGITGIVNPQTITVDGNENVTATFNQNPYTLGVNIIGSGLVTKDPYATNYSYGTEVTLIPTPGEGWSFSEWSGDCTGSGSCVVTINDDINVAAIFTPNSYTLGVSVIGSGTVTKSPDQPDYIYGTEVTLVPTPAAGWSFSEWEGSCIGSGVCVLTIDGNESVTANFVEQTGTKLLTVNVTGNGSVTQNPLPPYTDGTGVDLTAVPATGWQFVNWTGACTGGGACSVTLDTDKTVGATFAMNTHSLTVTPPVNGTITPSSGTFEYGSEVELIATPADHYEFASWTGACAGQSVPCSILMDADKTVGATFEYDTFTLTVNQPVSGGTISPETSDYAYGTDVTLTATSLANYHFLEWTGACGGQLTNTCDVTVNQDMEVSAVFGLLVTIEQTAGGTINHSTTYHTFGSVVTLTATPATGYALAQWNGDCSGTVGTTCNLTIDGPKTVSATFIQQTRTLTINNTPAAGGTTIPSGGTYPYGTVVDVFPNPETGYKFDHWSGACSGSGACQLTMTADRSVTAYFTQVYNNLTVGVDPIGGGTTNPAVGVNPITEGSVINVTATSNPGFVFDHWSGACSGTGTCNVTMNIPQSVTAHFTPILHDLTISVDPVGGGVTSPTVGVHSYLEGTVVPISAFAAIGYTFDYWEGNCTGTGTCQVTMDSDKSVKVYFEPYTATFTLTYIAGPNGTISGDTTQFVNIGANGTSVTAVPNTGYQFVNWSDGSIANPRTDTNVTADITVTANFELTPPDCYALTLTHTGMGTNPEASPTNSVGCAVGTYIAGANITLSGAVPATGWQIVSWTGTTNNSSTAATNTVNMPAAAHTAGVNYTQITYTLTYIAGTGGTLTGETTQTVNYGANGTSVTAVPNTGYSFVDWSDGSTANPRTDTNVTANITVTANFAINTYTLTYTAGTGGTLTGDTTQTVNYGGSGTSVTAVPNTGYHFVDWSDGSIANPRTDINVTADITVTANFDLTPPDCYALTLTHTGMGTNPEASPTNSVGCAVGTYIAGANITLSGAVPATGWQIVSWTGTTNNSSTAATNTVNMPAAAHTAGVNYTQITYTLTYIAGTGGTLTGETTQTVNYGANGTSVTAVPNTGYSFVDWSDGSTANPRTDTNVTANITVTANFAINTYTLTVISEHGTVSKAPDLTTYNHGTEVLLTMSSVDPGWTFVAWSGGGCSGAVPCTVTITSDTTVTAVFSQNQYFIFIPLVVGGSIVSDPNQDSYVYGDEVLLTAVPDPGYVFGEWSGDCSGTNQTCLLLMENNKNVSATFFLAVEGTLTINAAIGGTITADPAGPYLIGDEVTLTATADTGYTFTGWTDDLSGTTNPITFTLESDMVVGASFTQELITLPKDLITDPGILRENFKSMDGWIVSGSGSGFYASVDTTNYKEGEAAIKMTTPATTGNVAITKAVNWDMATPDEQGNFRFWVYVHGTAAPRDFQILMSNDASFQNYFITYYNASYKFTNLPGWNQVNLRASDWRVGAGSPSWTEPITRVRFRIYGTSVASYSLDGLASGVTAMPAVVFTFDDADASLWTQAYAYMNDKNVRGTGYVVTDWVDGTNKVTWAQLQEMESAGWTIGNHTKAHTDLSLLTLAEQEAALMDARTVLSDHGITNSDYVAYPYGNYNEDTMMAMENLGMRLGRTMVAANNVSPLQSPFEISQREVIRWLPLSTVQTWVNTAVARQEILVLTFHDIGTSPTSSGWYVDRFRSLVDYLISQDIPIITMDDLYRLQSGDIGSPTECYTLTITHTGEGIDPVANPSNSDGCAVGTYLAGESITLSGAAPDTGWRITSWTGTINNGSTAVTNTVNMPAAAHAAGVNYIQITYTLTYIAGPGGSLTGETTQIVNYGANGTSVTAVPNIGYQFVNWSDGSISKSKN